MKAHFTLYVHDLHAISPVQAEARILKALEEAIPLIHSGSLEDLGYFRNIKDDAGEVIGSCAVKYEDGSVWRPPWSRL